MPPRRRLLLLTYCFPPAAVPESFLAAKRLGNLPGYEVDVVTIDPLGSEIRIDHSLDEYVAGNFGHILRVPLPRSLMRLLGRRASAVFQLPGLVALMNQRVHGMLREVDLDRYCALVTWSQWHAIHLVGQRVKRDHPGLPWIAHFSDPWAANPFAPLGGLLRPLHRFQESRVFAAADRLLVTSQETIDLMFSGPLGQYRSKARYLPHGFEPALYPPASEPSQGPLVLRSLGSFYGARSPTPLFAALALLRQRQPDLFAQIRVELIGSIPASFRSDPMLLDLPPGKVEIHAPVDYRTSLALMRGADLLLNVDAPAKLSVFLPSKLIDYVGSGRPILGITPPGAAAAVIADMGGWVADPDDPDGIATALAAAIASLRDRPDVPWGPTELRRSFAAETLRRRFVEIVEEAAGGA